VVGRLALHACARNRAEFLVNLRVKHFHVTRPG
jgi:hypothetical protein